MTKELHERFRYCRVEGGLFYTKKINQCSVGDRFGHVASCGYRRGSFKRKPISEHQLVWIYHGRRLPEYLDHINGDKTDNRIENLRPATRSQNGMNSRKKPFGKYAGVYKTKYGRFKAVLYVEGRQIYLGTFKNKETARHLRVETAKKYFGDFVPESF